MALVFDYLRQFVAQQTMPRKQIGFRKAIPKADEMQAAS
jgi:hypothetical protein